MKDELMDELNELEELEADELLNEMPVSKQATNKAQQQKTVDLPEIQNKKLPQKTGYFHFYFHFYI